jgi:ABC-type arginine transport system permease subunit
MTIAIALCALVVAVVLGLLGASARLSGRPLPMALGTAYTTIIRGINGKGSATIWSIGANIMRTWS